MMTLLRSVTIHADVADAGKAAVGGVLTYTLRGYQPGTGWRGGRQKPLLDVEQHENAGDNDDIQEQPDNGDRVVGIALFGRRVVRQRR
jgi:hypothetical protein